MEINIPTRCGECQFCGDYTTGTYSRNPHHCCEMIWTLVKEDYKVNTDTIDEKCPLKNTNLLQAIEDTAKSLDIESVSLKEE